MGAWCHDEPMVRIPSNRWPDDLTTGLPELDDAHRAIHRMLCGLQQTLEGGAVPEDLQDRVETVRARLEEHFRDEEQLMEALGYPHLEPHRADHRSQEERLQELFLRWQAPDAEPLARLMVALQALLMEHVERVDMDFARWEHLRRLEARR